MLILGLQRILYDTGCCSSSSFRSSGMSDLYQIYAYSFHFAQSRVLAEGLRALFTMS
jgi:hypothetical protein